MRIALLMVFAFSLPSVAEGTKRLAPPILAIRGIPGGGTEIEVGMKRGAAEVCCLQPHDEGDARVVDLRSNETAPAPPDPACNHPFGPRPQYCFERQGPLAHLQRQGMFKVQVPAGRSLHVLLWDEEVIVAPDGTITRKKSKRAPLPAPAMD